ncbi:MAG: acyltransferase [Candidatus Latescibacterota bacterium]|jgi:peptidoglycan/LPS O-acetylase OafA/YrhL
MSRAPLPDRGGTLDNVQALRGVAVLLVVFFHLHGLESTFVEGVRLLPDLCRIGRGGVDLFFVISGLVMVVSTRRGRSGRPGEPGRFLLRRGLRIYPLYWFYSILSLSVFLLPAGSVGATWNEVDLLPSFLLWPQEKPPLLGVGWTLWHELYFYAVFALLLIGGQAGLARRIILWAGLVVAGGWAYWRWLNPPAVSLLRIATDPMTLEFAAGALIGWRLVQGGGRRGGWPVLLGGVTLWAGAAVFLPEGLTGNVPDRWQRVFLLGIPAALLVYGAAALEADRSWLLPRWLVWTGQASYSIYLSHILVLAVGRRLWFAVVERGHLAADGWLDGLDNLLALALFLGAVLAVGTMSYRLLEAPLMRTVRARLASLRSSLSSDAAGSPPRSGEP